MSGKGEELKGRAKEAAGAALNDDQLRQQGKIDQASGKVKQAATKVIDKVKNAAKNA
jgi:uncharacterized protein YjbJ (UPF0337 family)